ncbi:hypothetical protein ATE67_02400 [Sphingopyxis sp. H050]|jgi:acetyl esterase/lipase|uniref:alpha/beta hydrolase n=1 Tax=Sphingopyxis sp. H050 TaxID=1759072 RepID=UPI000737024E|nr:alpha/beta hydrolase [Sphingopyxis sp. H050]KTE22790.1 hypothetical protein ATE67_02400 [Sphingopyxis sp. H050]
MGQAITNSADARIPPVEGNWRRTLGLAGLFLFLSVAWPSAAAPYGPAGTEIRDIVYREIGARSLHLDAYIHPGSRDAPTPVIVYFHGGGWSKGARPSDADSFRAYIEAGFSVIAVEYRLAGEAPAPAAVQDARCALGWVRANAVRLRFDPERIVVFGTSAGGHIALMAGLLPEGNDIDARQCEAAPRPAAILDFFGPTDLAALRPVTGDLHPSVANWIGKRGDASEMAQHMSPVNWLTKDSPPIFIVHGDADPVVPISQSIDLEQRLTRLGVSHDYVTVERGGHGKFDPEGKALVNARLMKFLCLHKLPAPRACKE